MQNSGCHGNQKENINKKILVKNYWSDFKIIWYKWSLGDPLPKLFKLLLFVEKCGRQLAWPFLYPATKVWRGIMLYPSVSVRLSVRPSVRAHHFRSITCVFIHGIFSNFAYILLSVMSGMGLLMGKIRPFLTELLPFFILEKWFLACYSFTVHDI